MKAFNSVVSLFVVVIVALIIIPLPPFVLDIMFILNISLSTIILLMTMYIKTALDFSVFPSILLICTLFRLALNISSTRLILTNSGSAGQVIKTFGTFVLQGNIVVGFIVFLIIVLVNFLVSVDNIKTNASFIKIINKKIIWLIQRGNMNIFYNGIIS